MKALFFLLTCLDLIPRINAGAAFVDLSGVNFQVQDGDLAYDVFLPPPAECIATLDNCTDFSTFINYDSPEDDVVIPCGQCATMEEYANGETVTIGLLDVVGHLYFPEGVNMTLVTTGIVVQGNLTMTQSQPIDGEPEITILLNGTQELDWEPQSWNAESCIDYASGDEQCKLGKRGFVVAGGTLDIRGFPKEECPTWTKLADAGVKPPKQVINYTIPEVPPAGCGRYALNEDFSNGMGLFSSSLGASASLETENSYDGTPYVTVSNRNRQWQGLSMDITKTDVVDCLQANVTYLMKIVMRLDSENDEPSVCSQVGQNCPTFRSHYFYQGTELVWKTHFTVNLGGSAPDGEWTTYGVEVEFSDKDISDLNTYNTMFISGPETGVNISVSSISLELPDEKFYPPIPDPANEYDSMCNNLIHNGDAELTDEFPYPNYRRGGLSSHLWIKQEEVEDDSGNLVTNNYYAMRGREKSFESLEADLPVECIEAYAVYTFKARVRIHSVDTKKVRFTIKTMTVDNGLKVESIGYCPDANITTGWVYCERNFMFTDEHVGAEYVQFIFVSEDDDESDIDYDDISIELTYIPVNTIIINDVDVEDCWDVGADIMITSHTILPEDTKVVQISEISTNVTEGTTMISFNTTIPSHTSLKDDPNYAVEVAILSRNILIRPADEDIETMDPEDGGHMLILHTPYIPQFVEGIELRGMGQQGILGKYPFHIHLSENVEGTMVSKNTVRDSFQRCYVIHGSHNVTMSKNVAYNTFGHCFMIEDGFEQDNVFEYNIGAMTKKMDIHKLLSIKESDHLVATFWISNPNNHFIGNVCAGGEDTGFWYEFLTLVRGPSAKWDPGYDINPSEFDFGSFDGNIIHSNLGDGFKLYPNGYFPNTHAPFENMISFRNAGDGVLLHNSAKLWIKGGIYADNRVQVEVDKQADDVWVTDGIMVGYSEHFRKEVEASNTKSHCPASRPNVGVQLHSYLRFRDSRGYILRNITFEQFGEELTDCKGSVGIDLDPESRDGHFDAYSIFEDLHFPPNTPDAAKISFCLNEQVSELKDIVFEDWTGDLDPTGQKRPGAVVSRHGILDVFIEDCVELEGSCALYCPSGCYRGINFASSQAMEYEGWSIRAVSLEDPSKTEVFESYFDNQTRLNFDACETNDAGQKINCEYMEDHYNNYIYQRRRYFTATLPKGEYRLEFVDTEGEVGWPTFLEMVWEDNNTCVDAINDDSLTILVPEPTEEQCEDIIRNGGGEEGTVNFWMHAGGDVNIVNDGYNSAHAIASVTRTGAWQGPGQYLDTRCFNVDDYFEIEAKVKLQDETTGAYVSCNPDEKHYMHDEACPRFSFRMRELTGRNIGDEVITTFILPVAETVGPYNENGWNTIYGVLKITEHIMKQTTIFMFVERAKPGYRIIIDNVRMGRVIRSENDAAYNRGFESGDTRFWRTIGPARLDIVNGGHGGSSHALKAHDRGFFWASMEHELTQGTLVLGHMYAIKAKIKLELDGAAHSCVPGLWWGLEGRDLEICPTLTIRQPLFNSTHSNYTDIGVTVGQWDENDWNDIYGVLEVTQEMLDAPALTMMFSKLHESIDLIIDDVSVSEITDQGCNDLIWNGGGEIDGGNPYYWKMYGSATVDVIQGGMNSDYAIHVFDRTNPYDGVRQLLDPECINPGAVYEVTAWVKMLDTSGAGYECIVEQTFGDGGGVTYDTKRCPLIGIGAQNPGGAPQHRSVGSAYGEWTPGGWNLLKGHFKFFANEIAADSLFVSITRGPGDAVYEIDNVSMTIFKMPTEMPSIAPSAAPTITAMPSSSPSVSFEPSVSKEPSSSPTFSPRPTSSPIMASEIPSLSPIALPGTTDTDTTG